MPHPPIPRLSLSMAFAWPSRFAPLPVRSRSAPGLLQTRPIDAGRATWLSEDEALFAEARAVAGPVHPRDMDPAAAARSRRVAFVTQALRQPRASLGRVPLAVRAMLATPLDMPAPAATPLDAEPWELIDLQELAQ
jgi:hypothetical protein